MISIHEPLSWFLDVDDIVERVANIITAEDEESLSKSWRAQFEE